MKRLISMLTILCLSCWTGASAQSLAEIAKKEKQRREKLGSKTARSFDDRNLAGLGSAVPTSSMRQEGISTAPDEEFSDLDREEADQEDPTGTESYWRNRLGPVDRRIADIQEQLGRPGFDQDSSNMIRRQRLERDLERARTERQAILEEARKKGVPPGWLR